MHSSTLKRARSAAMLFLVILLVLGLAPTLQAAGFQGGVPWQIGDVAICFGSGTCNVVRIDNTTNPPTVTLLDQFSDVLLGDTRGIAINNTLHLLVTDSAQSQSGNTSNVVEYTIASVNPLILTYQSVPHTSVTQNPFSDSGADSTAVVVTAAGHMLIGNAGNGSTRASIAELNPNGSLATSVLPSNPFPLPSNCTDTTGQLLSMDLSRDGTFLILTSSGGNIQELTLATGVCTPFAQFGTGVKLYGIQDIPPSALTQTTCKGTGCPSDETILVVATGFIESDTGTTGEGHESPEPDSTDDTNICTNRVGDPAVSCALLLDTGGPGLAFRLWQASNPYLMSQEILDPSLHVQMVTGLSGNKKSGNTEPLPWNDLVGTTCSFGGVPPCTTTDGGVTWTDQGTSVVARYPVTGVSTLQSLSLDPLVQDCTKNQTLQTGGTTCFTSSPTVNNFWVGDFQSHNIYELDFATGAKGTPPPLNASPSCTGCQTFSSVQGLRIYGAENSTQADLTKLFTGSLSSLNNTAKVQFPLPPDSTNTNTWTVTAYNVPSTPSTPLTLYASLIAKASAPANGGNNSGLTDISGIPPSVPCQPTTTDLSKCIIWKADLPLLPSLPPTTPPAPSPFLAESILSPTGTDNGTDIFVDLHYDVTSVVGSFDPGGRSSGSVHSLHEIATTYSTTASGCFYQSPKEGACYKTSRTTLPFTFQCPGITPTEFVNLKNGPPLLSLVQTFPTQNPKPAPQPIQLTTTNNKAPYRYSPSANNYIFNWMLSAAFANGQLSTGTTTLRGCTFDPTNTVQTFCVNFTTNPGCPNNP